MKAKCTSSVNRSFVVGREYEVVKAKASALVKVTSEAGVDWFCSMSEDNTISFLGSSELSFEMVIEEPAEVPAKEEDGLSQMLEIISAPGVRRQMIHQALLEAKQNEIDNRVTEITFATSRASVSDARNAEKMVGIVLWVPRSEYNRITEGENK